MSYLHATESMVKRQSKKEEWNHFNLGRKLFETNITRYDRFICNLLSALTFTKKMIAEYGCGDGIWLEFLGKRFPDKKFVGIEWNQRLADYAVKHRLHNVDNVTIHVCDATETSVDCDFFYNFGLIEHFDDATNVIRNWATHLEPDGVALMTVPNLLSFIYHIVRFNLTLEQLLGKTEVTVEDYGLTHLWSHNVFIKKVMDAGLEIKWFQIVEVLPVMRPSLVIAFKRADKNQS